eukprot:m.103992 g.103992  ORF g.103992 m.103992 type:complete len:84 (-) comp15734_c1_seq5:38-289(-)
MDAKLTLAENTPHVNSNLINIKPQICSVAKQDDVRHATIPDAVPNLLDVVGRAVPTEQSFNSHATTASSTEISLEILFITSLK